MLQTLTVDDVRDLADSVAIFQRGEDYAESGAIIRFSAASHQLTAKIQGNYGRYTVQVRDDRDGLEGTCDCPYDGSVCKHLVAVLLHYLQLRDTGELDGVTIDLSGDEAAGADALEQALAHLSREQLLELVLELANDQAPVRRALLAKVPLSVQQLQQQPRNPNQVQYFKKQIHDCFHELQQWAEEGDFDEEDCEAEDELEGLYQEIQILHPADQVDLFWQAIEVGNQVAQESELYDFTVVSDAIRYYAQAVRDLNLSHTQKRQHLSSLLGVSDWQIGTSASIVAAIKQGLDQISTAPPDYQYLIEELVDYEDLPTADWIASYYLKLGNDAAYLRVRQANLTSEPQYLELAHYWQQQGNLSNYVAVLEAGAKWVLDPAADRNRRRAAVVQNEFPGYYGGVYSQSPLLEELADVYRQQSDAANQCRVLMMQATYSGVTLERYQTIAALAKPLQQWEQLRPQLIALAQPDRTELAKIYLQEQDWQAAIDLANQSAGTHAALRTLVAEGVKHQQPQAAIRLYKELIQHNIDRKSRKYYRIAAGQARALKAIYRSVVQDEASWNDYIRHLRSQYSRLPALQDEFASL